MSEHEPEATPQQQEAVRRLLAGARHDEPVPADVVARLDGVLAQLAAEGPRAIDPAPPAPHEAQVVDLAARRRRRVTGLLGAAAAVVVLGVGVTQVVDTTSGSDDAGSSSSEVSDATAADTGVGGAQAPESQQEEPAPSLAPGDQTPSPVPVKPDRIPAISKKTFGQAVLALRGAAVVPSTDSDRVGGDELTTVPMFVCPPAAFGEGRLLAVRYEEAPAVLAYRPASGETQSVELLQCGTAEVLRSKVIPFP